MDAKEEAEIGCQGGGRSWMPKRSQDSDAEEEAGVICREGSRIWMPRTRKVIAEVMLARHVCMCDDSDKGKEEVSQCW